MDRIRIFVEELISLAGLTGSAVPVVRHILLIVVAIVLAWTGDFLGRKVLVPLIGKLTGKTEAKWDNVLFNRQVIVSACHIIPAVIIWELLPMVFYQFPLVRELLARLTAIYITVMIVRTGTVFINSFSLLETDGRRSSARQYFQSFCGVLKILMFFVAAVIVVAIVLGRSPMRLFAGLGATSAILMLVFKDTISGLVAGIQLTSNNMVRKGDWITVPNSAVDGVVEEITLTTVKVRNFDHTIVTVTPQTLVSDSFQNWMGMQKSDGRRVKRKVFYDFRHIKLATDDLKKQLVEKGYFTASELQGEQVNMALYRRYVERMLAQDARVNHHLSCLVRQLEATSSGLPLEFYFFLSDKEWVAYEHQVADLMEKIYALAADFDVLIYQTTPQQ